jgi:hypothetical protein
LSCIPSFYERNIVVAIAGVKYASLLKFLIPFWPNNDSRTYVNGAVSAAALVDAYPNAKIILDYRKDLKPGIQA